MTGDCNYDSFSEKLRLLVSPILINVYLRESLQTGSMIIRLVSTGVYLGVVSLFAYKCVAVTVQGFYGSTLSHDDAMPPLPIPYILILCLHSTVTICIEQVVLSL